MFPDRECGCIPREIGIQQWEQRTDLIRVIVLEFTPTARVGWQAEEGCCGMKAKREVIRPGLGQVLQEWRGRDIGKTFLRSSLLPLFII